MSYWNHRIIRRLEPDKPEWFFIAEVYYNDDGSIFGYTEEPRKITGESIDDLRQTLQMCLSCLDKPILDEAKIEFKDDNGKSKKENF